MAPAAAAYERRLPRHGFEFDIRTGEHPTDKRVRLRRIPVRVADGEVYVTIREAK